MSSPMLSAWIYVLVWGATVNSRRNEQALTWPEDLYVRVAACPIFLRDGNTTNECSVKMVDTNEDEIEYDIFVTWENFHLGKSELLYLLCNKHRRGSEEQSPGERYICYSARHSSVEKEKEKKIPIMSRNSNPRRHSERKTPYCQARTGLNNYFQLHVQFFMYSLDRHDNNLQNTVMDVMNH